MKVNKVIWKSIKQICLVDEARARNLLKTNNLKTANGCINTIQDNDGNTYKVPNFCINQPFFEKEIQNTPAEAIETKDLHLYMYDLYSNKKYDINVNNKVLCSDIKGIFSKLAEITEEEYKLRFIFGGTELKDEHFIYQYKIDNEYTIQVYKMKKEAN